MCPLCRVKTNIFHFFVGKVWKTPAKKYFQKPVCLRLTQADELGRIVLPVELRRTMDIAEKDPLEIYVDGNSIVLRKYRPSCIFCDSTKDVRTFRGKNVCPRCLRELHERM